MDRSLINTFNRRDARQCINLFFKPVAFANIDDYRQFRDIDASKESENHDVNGEIILIRFMITDRTAEKVLKKLYVGLKVGWYI